MGTKGIEDCVFVHGRTGWVAMGQIATGTYCADCIPPWVDLGDEYVDTWRYLDDGWTGPIVCDVCMLAIPIIINGNKACEVDP